MRLSLVLAPLALMACIQTLPPQPGPQPLPAENACGAASLQVLVGQPATVLAAMTFPAPTRIIQPGMAVTMDYAPNRLNIWLGDGRVLAEGQVIQRVTCG